MVTFAKPKAPNVQLKIIHCRQWKNHICKHPEYHTSINHLKSVCVCFCMSVLKQPTITLFIYTYVRKYLPILTYTHHQHTWYYVSIPWIYIFLYTFKISIQIDMVNNKREKMLTDNLYTPYVSTTSITTTTLFWIVQKA